MAAIRSGTPTGLSNRAHQKIWLILVEPYCKGSGNPTRRFDLPRIDQRRKSHAEDNRISYGAYWASREHGQRRLLHRSGEGDEEVQGRRNAPDRNDLDPDRSGGLQDPGRSRKAGQDGLRGEALAAFSISTRLAIKTLAASRCFRPAASRSVCEPSLRSNLGAPTRCPEWIGC